MPKFCEKQAGFAELHSSTTLGWVRVGLDLGWIRVGLRLDCGWVGVGVSIWFPTKKSLRTKI